MTHREESLKQQSHAAGKLNKALAETQARLRGVEAERDELRANAEAGLKKVLADLLRVGEERNKLAAEVEAAWTGHNRMREERDLAQRKLEIALKALEEYASGSNWPASLPDAVHTVADEALREIAALETKTEKAKEDQ